MNRKEALEALLNGEILANEYYASEEDTTKLELVKGKLQYLPPNK